MFGDVDIIGKLITHDQAWMLQLRVTHVNNAEFLCSELTRYSLRPLCDNEGIDDQGNKDSPNKPAGGLTLGDKKIQII